MRTGTLAATILALAPLLGVQALGQTGSGPPTAASRPEAASLAIPELVERLAREGYRDIREVKRKGDKLYKVDARDANGRKRELSVDARTAEVLASEEDDDD